MTEPTTVMSTLLLDDGAVRPMCNGCTAILEEQGMVKRERDHPINARQPEFRHVLFRIVPPFTLAECQAAVSARHIDPLGRAWGEM